MCFASFCKIRPLCKISTILLNSHCICLLSLHYKLLFNSPYQYIIGDPMHISILRRRIRNVPTNPAIPTDFYKIVTRCNSSINSDHKVEKCSGTIHVISFILQHTNDHCEVSDVVRLYCPNLDRKTRGKSLGNC